MPSDLSAPAMICIRWPFDLVHGDGSVHSDSNRFSAGHRVDACALAADVGMGQNKATRQNHMF